MTDNPGYKLCPYCSEEIRVDAIKCKHCKSMLVEPAANVPVQTNTKKPIWKLWWGWCIAALFLIIIIFASCGDSNQPSPQNQASTSDNAQDVASSPVGEPEPSPSLTFKEIGEATAFNDWAYKLINVEIHSNLDSERARGQYVAFIFEMTNNAKTPRDVGHMFQAEDDQERVFSFDSTASLGHHHEFRSDSWHLDDIGPSFSATMAIVFDVPLDTKTLFVYPIDIRDDEFANTAVFMYRMPN